MALTFRAYERAAAVSSSSGRTRHYVDRPTTRPPSGRHSRTVDDIVVEATGLTKRYGSRTAVDRLDLRVRRGEVYGFLGPNGAGKTTALRAVLGLVRPSAGRVRTLGAVPGSPAALRRIGMLVEAPAFYPYLSARGNLRALGRLAGTGTSRIDQVLETVDLATRADEPVHRYSLGMTQRLGVAAALLKAPELVILDEPTNGLDPAGMADMRLLIRRLRDDGITVMLSSHLMGEVQHVCDRLGVVHHGRLLREGTVDELRGAVALRVGTDRPAAAREVLSSLVGVGRVAPRNGALEVACRRDSARVLASRIAEAMVRAGLPLHELALADRTLEDVFLELTGDRAAARTSPGNRRDGSEP
ncbi:ABC transporter ATP-binding protein [Cellulomonas dongxiuzhuiae]|uniref:ABC transporter ATP-binding protein n=1 Tax=Cellulomonas dongxiuzhuiae TaxID=2819979 RepID=A0ABX8GIN4_9CELL|nr:ABC transporter ATP-binding protein [Cellulomonas dongxiuzhuiae]QWC16064.1 ABC transporter ATP-binding protein [Cellulomonas dongxiuzhuiae]